MVVAIGLLGASCLAGCGETRKSSQSTTTSSAQAGQQLTDADIPDVLTSGIWPGAGLRAYRNGAYITIYTDWDSSETTVDGRTTREAALAICEATVGDFGYDMSLGVTVLAANGWEHLAFKGSGAKCHES